MRNETIPRAYGALEVLRDNRSTSHTPFSTLHGDAEPGGRTVEDQAHRFASELLMPTSEIRDLLPSTMGGNAWRTLAKLKEQWGVSMQALLFRARQLGRLGDVSYRNAMTTISTRGWRRDEPGLVNTIEQPSLLPRALELLVQEGVDENALIVRPPDAYPLDPATQHES